MPDSPDQIIRKLQQENKNLKKILKQKDKKLEQKDEELNLERQLWNSRESGWDPSTSTDLHRIEVFDGVISDESSLHSATLCSREEFRYILERTGACAIASGDMSLFRDDESRTSDPGNRCKLRFRHALLMSLIRKKDNPTQGTLQAIFGVDQTSVCRYLKVTDREAYRWLGIDRQGLACGAIIRTIQLRDVVWYGGGGDLDARADERMSGTGVPACYGFLPDSPRQLPEPIPAKGRLGLWRFGPKGSLFSGAVVVR